MKAVCWHGANDVRVETVPDPTLLNPHDAILKVTATTICGSDLHNIYDGYIPTMQPGDIIGHEFMGEIVDVGREVKKLKIGDRVVVSSIIGCGQCIYCQRQMWSLCDNSNPNGWMQEPVFGFGTSGIFMGQMFGQKYIPMLLERVANGHVDPSRVFTHQLPLTETKQGFKLFKHKQDSCIKVLLRP